MTTKASAKRSIEVELNIPAPVDAVWRALTDARELTRWFPMQAEVTPGQGGKVTMIWDEIRTDSRIDAWEPNRHLRTVGWAPETPAEFTAGEKPITDLNALVLDYYLEAHGGTTVLRLVHSGFASGSSWDEEFFGGVNRGWAFELRALRHYLQFHSGKDREVRWVRVLLDGSYEDAWEAMLNLWTGTDFSRCSEGDPYKLVAADGEVFSGKTVAYHPGRQFGGTVDQMNNGLMRFALDECGNGPEACIWLTTYGVPSAELDAFAERWRRKLNSSLPVKR